MKIPFLDINRAHFKINEQLMGSFNKTLSVGQFILGPNVTEFEKNYSLFNNVRFTVGTGNGLDALIIALKSLGVGPGDEVIIPSNTYIATALAVSAVGARIVFCEPDTKTYNIDINKIEKLITNHTKVILPVHLYGQACEMEELMKLTAHFNLFVVEDNAQAQGAEYNQKKTGSFGHINATSFYPGKNLGALGDGGAITTNSEELSNFTRRFRNYGSEIKYLNQLKGMNSRLDELQAGLLNIKLNYLDDWNKERRVHAEAYTKRLGNIEQLVLPVVAAKSSHVYHVYVIRTKNRTQLQNYLAQCNIGTLIHYPVPIHLQKAYSELNFQKGSFPIAEELSETMLSLPLFPGLTAEEIDYVCSCIEKFFRSNA